MSKRIEISKERFSQARKHLKMSIATISDLAYPDDVDKRYQFEALLKVASREGLITQDNLDILSETMNVSQKYLTGKTTESFSSMLDAEVYIDQRAYENHKVAPVKKLLPLIKEKGDQIRSENTFDDNDILIPKQFTGEKYHEQRKRLFERFLEEYLSIPAFPSEEEYSVPVNYKDLSLLDKATIQYSLNRSISKRWKQHLEIMATENERIINKEPIIINSEEELKEFLRNNPGFTEPDFYKIYKDLEKDGE